jgi:hypothetical protein
MRLSAAPLLVDAQRVVVARAAEPFDFVFTQASLLVQE